MPPTLSTIRTNVAKLITAKYKTGTPTAVGAGSLTHAAGLGLYGASYFINLYLLDSAGVTFFCTESTTAGVLTLRPTASTPGTGAYEIMLVHPTTILDAINRVTRRMYPKLNRWYVTENLVTGSPIPDPGFEDWTSSSALRAWAAVTTTLSRQSGALFGGWVARLGTAAGYLQLKAAPRLTMLALRGYTIDVHAWVKTSTASAGRINLRYLSQSAVATNNRSSYHSGGGGWERLSVTGVAIPLTAQEVDLRLENDTTGNVDLDDVWCEGGPNTPRLQIPDVLQSGPSLIYVSAIQDRDYIRNFDWVRWPFGSFRTREDEPEGTNLYEVELRKSPPVGVRLRVEGPAPLRTLSSDTDELLLTDKEQIILEIRSALEVLDGAAVGIAATSHASLRDVQAQLRAQLIEAERDLRAPTRGGNLNPDV